MDSKYRLGSYQMKLRTWRFRDIRSG